MPIELTLTASVAAYLRHIATEYIEADTEEEAEDIGDARDALWETMTPPERAAANTLAVAIFGPWL